MRDAAAVSLIVLCASLSFAPHARAYHVDISRARAAVRFDAKTESVRIRSLRDFTKCQKAYESSGSEACLDALRAYVKRHPKHAFAAGKLARVHFMHWVALDFFAQALAKKPTKRQCADSDLKAAVVSGLALPPHYPSVALASKLAQESCWPQLQPSLVADLKSASGSYRKNVCPLLADRQVSDRRCQRLKEAEPENAVALLKDVDAATLSVDPEKSEALRSARGEELMIARAKTPTRDYVLLKFKAVKSPWNERVLVAIERKRAGGRDYVISENDQEWIVLSERYGRYEAYPKGIDEGLWLNPQRPTTEPVHLPTRREIANEFAAVMTP